MILLDTHVLIWQEQDDGRLGTQTRQAIDGGLHDDGVAVSAISFWEIGMRIQKGQIELLLDLNVWRQNLLERGLIELSLDGAVAARAGLLPEMHGDPADRLIVATALGGHQLLTADQRILNWPGPLSRLDARE